MPVVGVADIGNLRCSELRRLTSLVLQRSSLAQIYTAIAMAIRLTWLLGTTIYGSESAGSGCYIHDVMTTTSAPIALALNVTPTSCGCPFRSQLHRNRNFRCVREPEHTLEVERSSPRRVNARRRQQLRATQHREGELRKDLEAGHFGNFSKLSEPW